MGLYKIVFPWDGLIMPLETVFSHIFSDSHAQCFVSNDRDLIAILLGVLVDLKLC
jgi:hypothetical protein